MLTNYFAVGAIVIVALGLGESIVRFVLVLANVASATVLIKATDSVNKEFIPHLIFIAFWSVVSGTSMFLTELVYQDNVNLSGIADGATILMVAGWTTLLVRIINRISCTVDAMNKIKDVNTIL